MTPSARIRINNGTGFLTFGMSTTMFWFENAAVGPTIRTAVVRMGFEVSSLTERISAE
uniref:Uncharacterized protein n=1 Tax=viral metagenome TaxID=1070528 RepID=A0A6C0E4S7_9ZZZZ